MMPNSLPPEFYVKVIPRAARNEVVGWTDGVLRVRVHAPPVEGRANEALIDVLAAHAGVSRGSFRIVQGGRSRLKRVRWEKP